MQFDLNGASVTARAKKSAEFEDISGVYMSEWDSEDEFALSENCNGTVKKFVGDTETIEVCMWHDADAGVTYSVSAIEKDIEWFDIVLFRLPVCGK